jgi:hypothetical protein
VIDNTSSIVRYDKGFAQSYLREKELLLEVLKRGNADLWKWHMRRCRKLSGN